MLRHQPLSIPIQGVSTKPDALKHPLQLKTQYNMIASTAYGMTRRLPFKFRGTNSTDFGDLTGGSKSVARGLIERSEGNYELTVAKGGLSVKNPDGTNDVVDISDAIATHYLNEASPVYDFKVVALGDSFLVLNKNIRVVDSDINGGLYPPVGSIWIRNYSFGQKSFFHANSGYLGSYVAPDGTNAGDYEKIEPSYVMSKVKKLFLDAGYTVKVTGSIMSIDTGDTLRIDDGRGGTSISYNNGAVETAEDLPSWAETTSVVKVQHPDSSSYYFVSFDGARWVEVSSGGAANVTGVDMPIIVQRYSDGWEATRLSWTTQRVGDFKSHPAPNFVGKTIDDIFVFRNRLCLVSGSTIDCSRIDDYTDFAYATARDVFDDDPIRVQGAGDTAQGFRFTQVLDNFVCLLSNNEIHLLGAGSEAPFTPANARLTRLYKGSKDFLCQPAVYGETLLTVSGNEETTHVNQLFIDAYGSLIRNPELTLDVPSYLEVKPTSIIPAPTEGMFFILNGSNRNVIDVCQLARNGEGVVEQLAWHKWEPTKTVENQEILYGHLTNGHLEIGVMATEWITTIASSLSLNNIDLAKVVYADFQQEVEALPDAVGSGQEFIINKATESTSLGVAVAPYTETAGNIGGINIIDAANSNYGFSSDQVQIRTNAVIEAGDKAIFGFPYSSRYLQGSIHPRSDEGAVLHSQKMQLRWYIAKITHGGFFVTVRPKMRPSRRTFIEPRRVANNPISMASRQVVTAVERIHVGADATAVEVLIEASDYMPLQVTTLEMAFYMSGRQV